jgi:hypothetical protein
LLLFVAKGRDGTTDIWGLVWKPRAFDPARKYPVIEYIYAGPHGSHVPKSFSVTSGMQAQADIGFIVVQIDGMGTSNRSKAFQDVAWRNIKDAGFPDRIRWHQAFAAKKRMVRHHARGHLRRFGGRAELDGRAALPPGVLQGRGVLCGLPRQPHGQNLVERTVDGLAHRPAVRRVVERR